MLVSALSSFAASPDREGFFGRTHRFAPTETELISVRYGRGGYYPPVIRGTGFYPSSVKTFGFAEKSTYTLAVPKIFFGIRLEYFDRGAKPCSLHRPQDALHRFCSRGRLNIKFPR